MNTPLPWLVGIAEGRPDYFTGEIRFPAPSIHGYGYGEPTLEAARSGACAAADRFRWPHFRVEIRRFCDACGGHGVKPGCKRKPCPACKGEGSTPVESMIFRRVTR